MNTVAGSERPRHFERLAALLDRRFEREGALRNHNIQSFSPDLRFVEDLTSREDLLEDWAICSEAEKVRIWPDERRYADFPRLLKEAEERQATTGHPWDGQVSRYRRSYTHLEWTEPNRLGDLKRSYRQQRARL